MNNNNNEIKKFDRKEFADLLMEYYPGYCPYMMISDHKYKPLSVVKQQVYKILDKTGYKGNKTDYDSVQLHWAKILEERQKETSFLKKLEIAMVPHIRMKQLPKGLSKQDRHKWEVKYNEDYIKFLRKQGSKSTASASFGAMENEDED